MVLLSKNGMVGQKNLDLYMEELRNFLWMIYMSLEVIKYTYNELDSQFNGGNCGL